MLIGIENYSVTDGLTDEETKENYRVALLQTILVLMKSYVSSNILISTQNKKKKTLEIDKTTRYVIAG